MAAHLAYPNKARDLRARLLSQRAQPLEPFEIDGETFHLRTPTVADRDEVFRMARPPRSPKRSGNVGSQAFAQPEEFDPEDPLSLPMSRLQAAATLRVACDDVGAPIFEAADFDALQTAPIGSWLARLGEACVAKITRKKPDAPLESAADPGEASGAPRGDASSFSSPSALG